MIDEILFTSNKCTLLLLHSDGTLQIWLYINHYSLSKYFMSCNPTQGQTITSALSLSEVHLLIGYTSSTPALNLCTSSCCFLEDTQMSLFSSKSVGQGSNQRLSFLGKPQAFCKELWKLSAFMFSYAFCLGSLS